MKNLGKNWFIEPAIDFELKKYTLLAWLQNAEEEIGDKKMFPVSDEITEHIRLLEMFLMNKKGLEEQLQRELTGYDQETGQLVFHPKEDFFLNEINEVEMIVRYSLKKLREWNNYTGSVIDEMSKTIRIAPVGLEPLYKKEGYIFIPVQQKIIVFEYSTFAIYRTENAESYTLQTTPLHEFDWTLSCTLEGMKHEIHRTYHKFDVPAVFLCESSIDLPLWETLLPLAEKKLLQTIYHE